jgi:hypothetical protein
VGERCSLALQHTTTAKQYYFTPCHIDRSVGLLSTAKPATWLFYDGGRIVKVFTRAKATGCMAMSVSNSALAYVLTFVCSAVTVWSAWDRGGGYYSTQMIVALCFCGVGLLAALLLTDSRCGKPTRNGRSLGSNRQPPPLVVLAIAIWAGAMLQTLPLPHGIAAIVAPGSSEVYSNWFPEALLRESADSGDAVGLVLAESATEVRVSVAATYTRLALLAPLAFAAMCWICFLCFRRVHSIFLFLSVIAGSATIFSFFGLIDTIRLVRDWQVELRQMLAISPVGADDPFGPFVNNNNASGFLCLAIGCTLGLFVLAEQFYVLKRQTAADDRGAFSPGLTIARLGSAAVMVTLVAGVFASNSRGGFLGLLAGSIVVVAFLLPRVGKLKFAFVLGGVGFSVWLLISALGFDTRSRERFETLLDERIMEDPRLDHWSDALVAASHYLPFGSGLGTYRYACLPFQDQGVPLWFVNADGMPIEWLVEGGVWLLPMLALGVIVLVRHVRRIGSALKRLDSEGAEQFSEAGVFIAYAKSVRAVALFSIPALLVTQCFDFGITLMPLLLTFAGISSAVLRISADINGQVINSTKSPLDDCDGSKHKSDRASFFITIGETRCVAFWGQVSGPVVLAMVTVGLAMSANELHVASVAQDEMSWLRRERKQKLLVDVPGFSGHLARLEELASANPGKALIWKAVGEFRIAEQQRLGAERLFQLQPDSVDSHASWLEMKTVRHASYGAQGRGSFSACLLPTQSADEYRKARQDFINALLLNPLDPAVRISLLELDMVAPNANAASPELLLQAAKLRSRSDSFLDCLLWFASDYPGADSLPELDTMRDALSQERLQEAR